MFNELYIARNNIKIFINLVYAICDTIDGNSNWSDLMSKKTIISSILIIGALILAFVLLQNYKPTIDRIKSAITVSDSLNTRSDDEEDMITVYTDIHHMSHNVVIAEDKWGYKDLTLENIEKLIDKVTMIEDHEKVKKEVIAILTRWQNGDFSRVHFDHNYVWGKLGGTVGRAKGVNTQNLPDWANES